MSDNVTISNSYLSLNPDLPIRTTQEPTSGKHIQHVAVSSPWITYQDDATASVSYYGFALPGTATSAASWRIQKKLVAGTVTSYTYADGNTNFDNIWDNRAGLSYS